MFSVLVKSQITFDYSIPANTGYYPTQKISTTSLGDKLVCPSGSLDTVSVYNLNGTLYRNIVLPGTYMYSDFASMSSVAGSSGFNGISSVSDELFNSDTLLEFLAIDQSYAVSVINELGEILFTFPDSTLIDNQEIFLFTLNGNYKLGYAVNSEFKVFSLPGSLPCNACSNVGTGIVELRQGSEPGLNVYPNPFNNSLEIQYALLTQQQNARIVISDMLGRELMTVPLVNQSDNLNLNTANLPKGTLIVTLFGDNSNPLSKKVIKID